ncbi:MarR family winged helix-turn-helix transcriptional regulator [Pseudoflavitalea rhizosphaerae]|uniref:MarR family winged helix-turn-helix transcriptional regulator n=1 Tax=Pseudoflavitalea rhizosphaerae TaxID=1884793 RepID=UPI000F8F203C|nr:MarR family winged helix-turn-helix transcriptional regulator [Pseudoflavitalea rhizosphaerae]
MKTSESKFRQCFYFASGALARIVEKMASDVWKKVDLSPSHAYVLLLVLDEPGMQPGSIAGQLHLTPSTITRLLEKLESKKLVVRTSEGKLTNVYPTPRAKELQPQLIACAEEFSQHYYKILGKEECDTLIDSITKMADQLDK